jgi:hypothetical protein
MQKAKRVRRKCTDLQIQQALNAAQELDGASNDELSIAKMKLVQTRLSALLKMQARERYDKLKEAIERVAVLEAENERLTRQHEQDAIELTRLRAVCKTVSHGSFDDVIAKARTHE